MEMSSLNFLLVLEFCQMEMLWWEISSANGKCQIFDPMGNFVSVFGAGILSFPRQLFVDSEDSILVANEESVEVFNSDGTHLHTIGKGVISFACGVCMDKRARIIACDSSKPTKRREEREREREKAVRFFLWLKKCWVGWC